MDPGFTLGQPDAVRGLDLARRLFVAGLGALPNALAVELKELAFEANILRHEWFRRLRYAQRDKRLERLPTGTRSPRAARAEQDG